MAYFEKGAVKDKNKGEAVYLGAAWWSSTGSLSKVSGACQRPGEPSNYLEDRPWLHMLCEVAGTAVQTRTPASSVQLCEQRQHQEN